MKHYAIIENNRVVGISTLYSEVEDDGMILIEKPDHDLIGRFFDSSTGEFSGPDPETVNMLFLHLELTGGDGRNPVGIKNNGIDFFAVKATFRVSDEPSSPVITDITGMSWRITVRNGRGDIYDIVDVEFKDGVAAFNYSTGGKPEICCLDENDLEPIVVGKTTYKIVLIGESTFKVYRKP